MSLWLPPEPPPDPPPEPASPLLARDDESVKEALTMLFRALNLNNGSGIDLYPRWVKKHHEKIYNRLCEDLLGDILEQEVLC